ncbi:MAG: mechanosensitive ion channel protein MscS [Herbaspirillum sp.]|jgi:small conductance mechanosensitive channel|nr:mechanosensitive ion channel protein MscS [Herbaspirillum sp.]
MSQINFGMLLNTYLVPFGLKILAAIAIWIIGTIVINAFARLARRALSLRHLDPTLANYAISTIHVALRIVLIMAIMEVCGISTTSFAALVGAAGVAIGVAWSGLLSNFAAGIFLVVLRPFKVGDYISAAGQTGTVTEIGLFMTIMTTDNNLRVYIGNNKLFADNIINYNVNATRRVDLRCQLSAEVDSAAAIALLTEKVSRIPNVQTTPAVSVSIVEFNALGTLLGIRLFAATPNFGQVNNDTNTVIAETARSAGWPAPATYQVSVPSQAAPPVPAAPVPSPQ